MTRRIMTVLVLALVVDLHAIRGHSFDLSQPMSIAAPPAPAVVGTLPPPPVEPPVPEIVPLQPPLFDYSVNLGSDVFGANLFSGAFARQGATQFNADYIVAVGDNVQVRVWGAHEFEAVLTVDPQGNIFLPRVGPLNVLGLRNQDLQRVTEIAVKKVFVANVYSYASLVAAQPVRVFVGGYVNRPGLYSGTSTDSLLNYLDQAGGIDLQRGSFLNVQVKRGEEVRGIVNLYDFLLGGRVPLIQFAGGDVVFVGPRQNSVSVLGLAESAKRIEFSTATLTVTELARIARPLASATHVRVMRNTGTVKNQEYYPLEEAARVILRNGDEVVFTADKKAGTIAVRVEGEHASVQEYVLPHGTRLGELIKRIQFTERSDTNALQLYRQSVRERQRVMFASALKSLEASVLTARSATSDEARLRKEEADMVLGWVERAKKVDPTGQIVIAKAPGRDELLLENGDLVRVPTIDGLVLISGEVLFPTATMFNAREDGAEEYIKRAGGFTQRANTSRVIIAHRDGSYHEGLGPVRPGDEILVLPKIDVKSTQIFKDLTQILFQIAVSAKVILGL